MFVAISTNRSSFWWYGSGPQEAPTRQTIVTTNSAQRHRTANLRDTVLLLPVRIAHLGLGRLVLAGAQKRFAAICAASSAGLALLPESPLARQSLSQSSSAGSAKSPALPDHPSPGNSLPDH